MIGRSLGFYCGRTDRRLLALVHVLQTGLVKTGFFGSCSCRQTEQVTSIKLGGHIRGSTSIFGGAHPIRMRTAEP